jgi:N-acetylglutamate synthase-like GNAT family acetyltransferase
LAAHGLGTALLRGVSNRARRLGKDGLECESRADDDYSIGFLKMAVVLPAWRRRGIATTLLRAQIAAAKRAELETLVAWERSEHVGRMYGAKLGFEPRTTTVGFRGPLLQ